MSAYRHGISCPAYFAGERFGYRYRYSDQHLDLMDWISDYGAFRINGGLNLLSKLVGAPGKIGTSGADVAKLYAQGRLQEASDYCCHDVLDTYFVFLRTRILTGELTPELERERVSEATRWIEQRSRELPSFQGYLDTMHGEREVSVAGERAQGLTP
jgi:predicted PolB exonuclease-like 3'-5' exonuclease